MRKKWLWLACLVVVLLLPATTAWAAEPVLQGDGGRIFVDQDVSLEPNERFDGDLGVFNGDLSLPAGSVVNGDVFVADGDVHVAGRVNGDVAVFGGDLDLTESGWVDGDVFGLGGEQTIAGRVRGDLSTLGGDMALHDSALVEGDLLVAPGRLEREAGAQVRGEEMHDLQLPPLPFVERPEVPEKPEVRERVTPPTPPYRATAADRLGRFVGKLVSAAFLSLAFVGVGLLAVVVWPRRTERVADCVGALPIQSFGLGLLTFLIAAALESLALVLMIIIILIAAALIGTVILIPIGLLMILLSVLVLLPVPLALAGAMVLGWVGLAQRIGRKVAEMLKAGDVKPLGTTLLGMLITVPLAALFWIWEPVCCAWPFVVLLTSVGLGAVVHTRFGRQRCRPSGAAAPPPPPAPAAADVLPVEAMDDEAGQPDGPPPTP